MSKHIVLLGDSIFDNAVYVAEGRAVINHLQASIPSDWQATLLAVDGAVVGSVASQIARIPADATHLVLSVGGNDALGVASGLFMQSASNVGEALQKTAAIAGFFRQEYQRLMKRLAACQLPLTACTIYDSVPGLGAAELAGLGIFNDTITRSVFACGANLIDLRLLCDDPADYSPRSPIEPSDAGGRKIVAAIVRAVEGRDATSRIY